MIDLEYQGTERYLKGEKMNSFNSLYLTLKGGNLIQGCQFLVEQLSPRSFSTKKADDNTARPDAPMSSV